MYWDYIDKSELLIFKLCINSIISIHVFAIEKGVILRNKLMIIQSVPIVGQTFFIVYKQIKDLITYIFEG